MDSAQYKELKEKEMEYAISRVEAIKNSQDPHILYRDMRPVVDIKQMIESSVELYGEKAAFHVKDYVGGPYRNISYKQMKADMDAFGTALLSMGLKDKTVSIIGENRYEWAISYLSVVCGTGVVVPLDKELSGAELSQLVAEADVECVIFDKKYEKIFLDAKNNGETKLKYLISMDSKESTQEILSFEELVSSGKHLVETGNRDFVDAQIMRDEMRIILFTSGTTGFSKGVMLSHGNIVEDVMSAPTLLNVQPEDIFFSVLPIHHTYECTCGFIVPLYRGASIAYCEGLKYIVKNLGEARPTMFLGVPLIVESLHKKIWQTAKKSGKDKALKKLISINNITKKVGIDLAPLFFKKITSLFGGRLRIIICGGAAIDPAIVQGIKDFGINCVQGYGLTECAPICALNPDKMAVNSSAGYPPPSFALKIHDPDSETGIGEICTKGGNVMMGYFNNQEATDEVLKDGWLHTGDLGYIDKEGYVYITGRRKNVIITKNGKNVFPEELENYIGKIPYVSECLVWGKDNEETGETTIVASVIADSDEVEEALGKEYSDQDVLDLIWKEIDEINEQLPLFKKIKRIYIRKEEFEKTTGKKIKRFVEANKTIS